MADEVESRRRARVGSVTVDGSFTAAFDDAEVVVCCGSGGVGKTTIAAVLAMQQARAGRRVVVVTIDPARRLADALGLPGGLGSEPVRIDGIGSAAGRDGDGSAGAAAGGELWAMMLDVAATFDGLVREHAADDEQADRILRNPFYRNIAGVLSGTQEYMAAEALYELHHDERFDLVVVDTPPSRHALDFLEAPGVLARFLDHRLFRLLMLPARRGMRVINVATQPVLKAIGKVVGSDVLTDTVAFFQAFAGMEVGFRERADGVQALLRSDETRYVLVAAPRHDAVDEAVWFAGCLHGKDLPVSAVIVNRMQPQFGAWTFEEVKAASDGAGSNIDDPVHRDLSTLWRNLAEIVELAEAERAVLDPLLAAAGEAPLAEVPLLDEDVHDARGLERIRSVLFGEG